MHFGGGNVKKPFFVLRDSKYIGLEYILFLPYPSPKTEERECAVQKLSDLVPAHRLINIVFRIVSVSPIQQIIIPIIQYTVHTSHQIIPNLPRLKVSRIY